MGSRDNILARIKANKPDAIGLPQIDDTLFDDEYDLIKEFTKKVEVVGGNVLEAQSNQDILKQITTLIPNTVVNFSTLSDSLDFNTINLEAIKNPQELEDLDILILESDLGVAENGAVWVTDKNLPIRVLPFITKHLVFVISKENIVPYMHQAYNKLSESSSGFGVFISGPSKTADIEQSLVIGAHGALSLTIFLKN
ncbi:LutC/YkgG family protein [Thalassobellus suaedae]|uniref:LUD domain-containing protein n=1 Tax=Thalassobellus suaedae TaxID=3074124 RepID=A0ABY9XXI2_9FLAO|nr:LUD domain-containing protein [Flavobacteriaceae bacterium HL-DH14]WNH12671.1 LUD domain-containing protein [Flavobacteriaceae bacterium HL-DH10]